jgi:hypothetical protein
MNRTSIRKPTKKTIGILLLFIYFGVFLVLFLAWGINLSWHAIHLVGLATSLQESQTDIQPDSIFSLVEDAAGDINVIYNELSPLFPIFNALHGIPKVGRYMGQVEPLLIYVNGLAQAGNEIALGLEPLMEESQTAQVTLSIPERASQLLESEQDHFINASQAIHQAGQVRSRIQPDLLPASVRLLYLKLDGKFDLISAGIQALHAAPKLLGVNHAQSYLVLAQNRDELRATGGFISGIGLLTLQDGKILQFDLGDSYRIDDYSKAYPTPPEPLKRFMLADYWVTRDSNWSPDFPIAAQEAQALYTLSTGVQTQGVIAFNQQMVKKILEVIGPVEVPGTDQPVTAENVEDYMRQAWAPSPEEGLSQEWWLHRKDFMSQLGSTILIKALNSGDQAQLLNLAKTMVDLLDQHQLLLYFNDPMTQAALEAGGWDGAMHPGNNDFLYQVDSNVGFNKVDAVIQRSLAYRVDLNTPNQPVGEVTLTYQHTGSGDQVCKQEISYGTGTYQDMQERCYLDFWRVYVPSGSKVITSNAQSVPKDELLNGAGWSGQVESLTDETGTEIFAGLLMLPPSQSTQIIISYSLPSNIIQPVGMDLQEYVLRVQVQPGLEGLPFQLEIKLPNNSTTLNPGEGWKPLTDQTWIWQGILDKSIELSLIFQSNP